MPKGKDSEHKIPPVAIPEKLERERDRELNDLLYPSTK